jgi:hypothetical protein
MKSGGGLRVKVAVVVRVNREEEKEEKARTAALGGAERLNRAQMIQRQLQTIEESNEQIITMINKLQRNCIYY